LIAGLEEALELRPRALHVRGDSKLVIEQLAGRWRVRQPHLVPLHQRARALLREFPEVDLEHVRRENNVDADALVNAALDLT
jgi:ribonuclease HI